MTATNRPTTSLSLVTALLALAITPMAPATPRQTPTSEERPSPPSPPTAGSIGEAKSVLTGIGAKLGQSMIRVRRYREFEHRRSDGALIGTQKIDEGLMIGLIITDAPLIMVSASANRIDHVAKIRVPKTKAKGMSEPRYSLVLRDGTEVAAEVARHERSANLILLRPAPDVEVPESARQPISFADGRRPRSTEFFGIVSFRDPTRGPEVTTVTSSFLEGQESFVRPVVRSASVGQVGAPIVNLDGTLAGIVNLAPPEEGLGKPESRRHPMPPGRDPMEWVSGFRRPILMNAGEIQAVLDWLATESAPTVPFQLLGLTLRDGPNGVDVVAVDAASPAAVELAEGDRIEHVGGEAVRSIDEFVSALERTFVGDDPSTLRLTVRRGEREWEAELTLP